MKRIIVCAAIGIMLVTLMGCGGGCGETGSGLPDISLAGTWRTTRLQTPAGASTNCPGSLTLAQNVFLSCSTNDTITYLSNGTFTTVADGLPSNGGTWSLNGSTLHMVPDDPGGATLAADAAVALSGNTLTLTVLSTTPPAPEGIGIVTTMVRQ